MRTTRRSVARATLGAAPVSPGTGAMLHGARGRGSCRDSGQHRQGSAGGLTYRCRANDASDVSHPARS
jgi:hypothetical protein